MKWKKVFKSIELSAVFVALLIAGVTAFSSEWGHTVIVQVQCPGGWPEPLFGQVWQSQYQELDLDCMGWSKGAYDLDHPEDIAVECTGYSDPEFKSCTK